jgi:hypothetical protein
LIFLGFVVVFKPKEKCSMCCLPINQVGEKTVDPRDLPREFDSSVLEENFATSTRAQADSEWRGYFEDGRSLLE